MPAGTMIEEPALRSVRPGDTACCCPSKAIYQVVMPPSPARPHSTELLLCGHHARVSMGELIAARAIISPLGNPGSNEFLSMSPR